MFQQKAPDIAKQPTATPCLSYSYCLLSYCFSCKTLTNNWTGLTGLNVLLSLLPVPSGSQGWDDWLAMELNEQSVILKHLAELCSFYFCFYMCDCENCLLIVSFSFLVNSSEATLRKATAYLERVNQYECLPGKMECKETS